MIQERKRNAAQHTHTTKKKNPLARYTASKLHKTCPGFGRIHTHTHTHTHQASTPPPFSFSIFVSLANSILSSPSEGLNADNLISGCASSEGRD